MNLPKEINKIMKNFISVFWRELCILGIVIGIVITYYVGYIVCKEMKMDINELFICIVGFASLLSLVLAGALIFLIFISTISFCQIFVRKLYFLTRMKKVQEKINQATYENIEDCFVDVVPLLCRKATWIEVEESEKWRDKNYRIVFSDFTINILKKIDKIFSTSEYQIETFIKGKKIIGYTSTKSISGEVEEKSFTLKEIMERKRL